MSTNAPQIQRINHFARKVLDDFPVPAEIAARLIREQLQPFSQEELDPDTTYLTTIEYNTDNPNAPFTGTIVQSMTLTEAMICNAPPAPGGLINTTSFSLTAPYFNIVDELPRLMDNRIPAMFNEEFLVSGWIPPQRYEAIYRQSHPQVYDPSTQLDVAPSAFRKILRSSQFEQTYDEAITQFWKTHQQNYKTLMRMAFIKAYLAQFEEFTLTPQERLLAARAAGISVDKDRSNLTLQDMQAPYQPDKNLSLRLLRIHQAEATDILTITDNTSQVTLLYIPGNSSPFHGFNSPADMRKWLLAVAKDATQRKALTSHFDPETVDSGLIYSGVEEALIGMAVYPAPASPPGFFNTLLPNSYWDPEQYINNPTYPTLGADPFNYIALQIKTRIAKLAAKSIVSPLDTFKTETIDALEKACVLAIPVSLAMGTALLAEFCFVSSGMVEMAIGADDMLKDKPHSVERIVFGALNALPVMVHGVDKEVQSLNSLRPKLTQASRQTEGQISVRVVTEPGATETPALTESRQLVTPSAPSGLQTVKVDGEVFMTYKTPNNWGFFELFVPNPHAPRVIQATGLYAIQSTDLKWRRAGLRGGGAFRNSWQRIYQAFGGSTTSTFSTAYELPASLRDTLADMLTNTSTFSEHLEPIGRDQQPIKEARSLFFERRKKLATDSSVFFGNLPFSPMQPQLPSFSLNESQQNIIQKLLHASEGLVVGESHGALSSKAFLIDNMQTLASQGVKRIYFEHLLTDVHIPLLKAFYRSRSAPMSEELRAYLNGIYPPLRGEYYSFQTIVTKARDAGIKIQPIDCTASYITRDMADGSGTLRQRMMNYYATEVIQWVQTTKRRPGKWVALVGDSHTNTFQGVPGLAELTASIGLRIEDARAGQRLGIEADAGRTSSLGIGRGEATVKANLVLRVDRSTLKPPATQKPVSSQAQIAKTPQTLLTKPGQFMLTAATPTTAAQIHRRSRRGDIQSFRVNQQGSRFSVQVPGSPVGDKSFGSLQALVDGLKASPGMEEIRTADEPGAGAAIRGLPGG